MPICTNLKHIEISKKVERKMQKLSKIFDPGNFKISGIQLRSYCGTELCRFRIFAKNATNFSLQLHQIIRSASESSVSIRMYLLTFI
jgi:hypothetical protein